MHDFGKMDLHHLKGVFKASTFYKKGASRKDRTFTILSGPGAGPASNTHRKMTVKWDDGGLEEVISSYDIEILISKAGKDIKAPITAFSGNDVTVVPDAAPAEPPTKTAKPRGRGAWKSEDEHGE